jgi:hypothetical protein
MGVIGFYEVVRKGVYGADNMYWKPKIGFRINRKINGSAEMEGFVLQEGGEKCRFVFWRVWFMVLPPS